MKFLHPSYLNWLWLFRRIQFLLEEYSALVIMGLPNRAESWCWLSQSSENHLVKTDFNRQNSSNETRIEDLTGQAAPSALELAASQFHPSLCADGQAARSSQEQWQQLLKWAAAKGLILDQEYSSPERSDTSEHEVRFDEPTRRWFKYTIPGLCGFSVDWNGHEPPHLRMATPDEYFQRLCLQNELFADDINLVGFWNDINGGGWRMVTSQPDIVGEPATRIQILEGMRDYGFSPLPVSGPNNAPAFRREDVIVWDAHPGNFVMTPEGVLVPIDLIITENRGIKGP